MRRRGTRAALTLTLTLVACSAPRPDVDRLPRSTAETTPSGDPAPQTSPAAHAGSAAPAAAARGPASPAGPGPAPAPASASREPQAGDGDACAMDADCGPNDACGPTRCVARASQAREPVACDESWPLRGACRCIEGQCTLEPSEPPPASEAACASDYQCGLDVGAARCLPDEHRAGNWRALRREGPSCFCEPATSRCAFRWHDPVPCRTVADCWVLRGPRAVPIARPRAERGRAFQLCRDGERAPICEHGFCALGPPAGC